jgi:hypothetical protein
MEVQGNRDAARPHRTRRDRRLEERAHSDEAAFCAEKAGVITGPGEGY